DESICGCAYQCDGRHRGRFEYADAWTANHRLQSAEYRPGRCCRGEGVLTPGTERDCGGVWTEWTQCSDPDDWRRQWPDEDIVYGGSAFGWLYRLRRQVNADR